MAKDELLEKELLLEDFHDALQEGYIEEAEDICDEYIEMFSADAIGHYHMARLQQMKGDWEEALHFLTKAIELSPDQPQFREDLARVHIQLDEEDLAIEQLDELIDQFPEYIPAYIMLADIKANNDQMDEAIDYLNNVLVTDTLHTGALFSRANLYQATGRYQDALVDVNTLLSQAPDHRDATLQKIQLCSYLGQTEDLVVFYKESIDRFEDDLVLMEMYADFLLEQSDYTAAEKMFSSVIEKQELGEFAALSALLGRAWANMHNNKLEVAYADFNKASQIDSSNAEAYLGMVSILAQQRTYDLALSLIDVGLTVIKSKQWMLKEKKADVHVQLDQYDLAEQTYMEMIQTENEYIQGRAYFQLGHLHFKQGKKEKAYHDWLSASERYYFEADECLEEHCSDLIERDQEQAKQKMIASGDQYAKKHSKSAILKSMHGKLFVLDLKETLQSNKEIDKAPKAILDEISKYLKDMTFIVSYHGMIVTNTVNDPICLIYELKEETKQQIELQATTLDQQTEKTMHIKLDGSGFTLSGLADEDADLDLVFKSTDSLPSSIDKQLKVAQKAKRLDYLQLDWSSILN